MRSSWRRRAAGALALGIAAAAAAAPERGPMGASDTLLRGTPPAPGHYEAQFCVTVGGAAADCGTVSADVAGTGYTLVRISDILYRLQVMGDQLGVSLFHGTMQIDGFFAPYRWNGATLQFGDVEKGTRYELKLGPRRFDAP
jgi:hypothetical protein